MKKRKITNAHQAYWFLYDHPSFMQYFRIKVEDRHTDDDFLYKTTDPDGTVWGYMSHMERDLETRLDLHYALVDRDKRVSKHRKSNIYVECWLEFGSSFYGLTSGTDTPLGDWDQTTFKQTMHDIRLDVGGSTFDEALIKLAKKVLKHYGDYKKGARPPIPK